MLWLFLAVLATAQAQQQVPAVEANRLPVKRVLLYKNGVGYFEHVGRVRGTENVTVNFTSGQLNDALKSLTVLDLDGGRITGVSYASAAPVDRQFGDLRLGAAEKTTLSEFLGALRGARLEIRSGTTVIAGRLLSVERKTRISGGTTLEVDYVSVITDAGEVRTTEVSPSFSVRLLEAGLSTKVARYLDLVASTREADVRPMIISATGSGERSLFVSYIAEVPVWKATYRVVLSSKPGRAPLLQGWAIVDNTVGQDWDKVELSLVAGAPQSFIQKLSQPFYTRRPVIPLPESYAMSPQTHEATLAPGGARIIGAVTDSTGAAIARAAVRAYDESGTLVAETAADANGKYEFAAPGGSTLRLEVESPGFKNMVMTHLTVAPGQTERRDVRLDVANVAETVEVRADAPMINTTSAALAASRSRTLGSGAALGRTTRGYGSGGGLGAGSGAGTAMAPEAARERAEAAAVGQGLGDLFEYKLKEPVSIRKNQSALVPIVHAPIKAEKVSIWNDESGSLAPTRALWLTNTSGLTVDGGSFSVLEDETFAGEGIFEPIRPGEKRLVSYATDLALNANSRQTAQQQRVTRVRVNRGVMVHESEVWEKKTYTFRNSDTTARNVIVEQRTRPGYELRGEARPVETTAGWMRFRQTVAPGQTATLVVEEARPLQATYQIAEVGSDQVALFVRQQSIDKGIEDALRRVLAQKEVIARIEEQKETLDGESQTIFEDQERLRENLKALKGSAEEKALVERYTRRLAEQETRLESLKSEKQKADAALNSETAALNRLIWELSLDVKL